MILLFFAFFRLIRGVWAGIKDPQFQALGITVLGILIIGTIFYTNVEHWSVLNSFYFCVVTLSTVGYGDFTPHTDIGKIFTVIYIFIGVGSLVSFITLLASRVKDEQRLLKERRLKKQQNRDKKPPVFYR